MPYCQGGTSLEGVLGPDDGFVYCPITCEPLISQPLAACLQQNPNLAGLQLTDWADQESALDVDVLIGQDYYWNLVTGSIFKHAHGPTAIHMKLGWVLSGPTAVESSSQYSTNIVTHVLMIDTTDALGDSLRAF